MNRRRVCLTAFVVLGLAANLSAADKWKSAQVLPKEPARLILRGNETRPGNEYAANAFQISWPSHVEKTNGQWILIGDKGGYSVPPVKGWVRKDEMLSITEDDTKAGDEDPSQFLSTKILETTDPTTLAGLYWLRGIYWEGQQEPQVALRNYTAAIRSAFDQKVDPSLSEDTVSDLFDPKQSSAAAQEAMGRFPGLADAYVRPGPFDCQGCRQRPDVERVAGDSDQPAGCERRVGKLFCLRRLSFPPAFAVGGTVFQGSKRGHRVGGCAGLAVPEADEEAG